MYNFNTLEIITTDDSDRWDDALREIGSFDFFHLAAFHRLSEIRNEGKAIMPVYREDGYVIAFPLLLRSIELPFIAGTCLKDATSVAGLAGPVSSSADVPGDIKKRFHRELQGYFEQNSIVTVYSRLNPLMNQPALLEGYGEVMEIGVTVSIDLTPPPDAQFASYRRDHRKDVRRLRNAGFTCEIVGTECMDDFMRIYIETMDRLNANKAYYYDRSYFEYLLNEMPDVMHLFICKDGETVTSAIICSICSGIVQSYLGGTDAKYLSYAPSKLLNDAVRIWGSEKGARVFHMGGSLGGKRDSLYEFKMGFGGQEHVYSTWRHIVDQETYSSICREIWQHAGEEPDISYFPSYRHPKLELVQL